MGQYDKLKALGLSTYQPSQVVYVVYPTNLKELFAKYCTEYLKFEKLPELEFKFIRNNEKIDTYDGELTISNLKELNNEDYQRVMGMGMVKPSSPGDNFDKLIRILFNQPDYYEIAGQMETESNMIMVTCPYKDFKKFATDSDLIDPDHVLDGEK